jgi:hypothetical protein
LNAALAAIGAPPVDWLGTGWARLVVLVVYVWRNIGYGMIVLLASPPAASRWLWAATPEGDRRSGSRPSTSPAGQGEWVSSFPCSPCLAASCMSPSVPDLVGR